jgi:dipeptidyl aminopeptidase/acylaminoacyl peptidase
MRLPTIGAIAMMFTAIGVHANPPKRLPTLDDAFAVQSVGNVAASPTETTFAVESGGSIKVIQANGDAISLPPETRSPIWSPDGTLLAFYIIRNNLTQLAVWNRATKVVRIVTDQPDGISPNPWSGLNDQITFTWSPDSREIALTSRHMPGFEDVGKPEPDAPIRVYDRTTSLPFAQLEGFFRFRDIWEALGDSPSGDAAPARMHASERYPPFARDHLYIVNVPGRSIRELPNSEGCRSPAWSPTKHIIAAICDQRPSNYPRTILDKSPGAGLMFFQIDSGARDPASPGRAQFTGQPRWSPDGMTIAMVAQRRLIGFRLLELYDVQHDSWTLVQTSGHSLADDSPFRWDPSSGDLIVKVRNRSSFELWRVSPTTERSVQIPVNGAYVKHFDVGSANHVLFVAESATYSGRVYDSGPNAINPSLRFDANKQLNSLWLAPRLHITWNNSRGEPVDGILLLPPNYVAGRRYPVVIDVYPGHATDGFRLAPTSQSMGDLTAARGFVVFLPALRTPHGAYAFPRDEQYTEEARGVPGIAIMTDDFDSGIRYLDSLGIIDPRRIGLFGHSNGGYTVNLLITETTVANCAAISAGGTNYFMIVTGAPSGPGTRDEITNSNYYDNAESYLRLSPWFRLNRVHIPVLLFGGDRDWDWSLQMSAEYGSLRSLGQDVTWVRYRDEEHWFVKPENIRDSFERVMRFFEKHLQNQ